MNLGEATYLRRNLTDRIVRGLCVLGTIVAIIPLASVLYYVLVRGIGALGPATVRAAEIRLRAGSDARRFRGPDRHRRDSA